MTQARLKRYANKYLFPHLQGWTLIQHALARRHDPALLLLINFDSSAYDKDYWSHIQAVVFPLYLGYPHLVLNIGHELYRPGRREWRLLAGDEEGEQQTTADLLPAIVNEAWPFLGSRATLERLVTNLPARFEDGMPAAFNLETLAGAELLLGNAEGALSYIGVLLDFLREHENPYNREYELKLRREWEDFGDMIRGNESAARELLRQRIQSAEQHFSAPPVTPLPDDGGRMSW